MRPLGQGRFLWPVVENGVGSDLTIYALGSGAGRAGVAVIRLSGPAAREIVVAMAGDLPPPRSAVLRRLRHPSNGELLDESLVLWFPAPRSFTGEDVAEFHCHGGRAVIESLLRCLGHFAQTRPAEAGEFTRRAFAHGRLDLTEVEGLSDLIQADTEAQRRAALRVALGENRALYEGWRRALIEAQALMEATIDFSDEDGVPSQTQEACLVVCRRLTAAISDHVATGQRATRLRDGVQVVIAGPPNAGKSSFVNWLAQREIAIVAAEPGTTRDVIEVQLDLGGVPVTVCDTAGLREAAGGIEREGIRRAEERLESADLVLWLSEDGQKPPAGRAPLWLITTKSDLRQAIGETMISVTTGQGLEHVLIRIKRFANELISDGSDGPMMIRERHSQALDETCEHLDAFMRRHRSAAIEIAAEDLRLAARALGRITGVIDVEDVLGDIFSRFCIGK